MAAIVSREEIDALLSQIQAEEVENEKKARDADQPVDASRVVRAPRLVPTRIVGAYQSPVVKARQIAYNPDPSTTPPPRKVVVRTLNNYQQYQNLLKNVN